MRIEEHLTPLSEKDKVPMSIEEPLSYLNEKDNIAMRIEEHLAQLDQHDRVRAHSATINNARIDRSAEGTLNRASQGGRDAVVRRLAELDREWDIDRALMANFALAGGLSYALGERGSLGWRYFFRAQLGFLLLHSLVGWCPPAAAFRRLGFRTTREIEVERQELKRSLEGKTTTPNGT